MGTVKGWKLFRNENDFRELGEVDDIVQKWSNGKYFKMRNLSLSFK